MNQLNNLRISTRMEGGLGDILLANRFIPAIKELYPNSEITTFLDTEGKKFQKESLELLYPSFYKEIKIIPNKKYKQFWVDCQFGCDNYYGALENIPDEIVKEMNSYDKFYDLHIDSLKWMEYDFDWYRYFKFFPKPEIQQNIQKNIILHLVSQTSKGHVLEDFYIEGLINDLCRKFLDYKIISICTEDTKKYFNNINHSNFKIHIGDIKSVIKIIASGCFMISTDSGFRYIGYGYGIPTLTFSSQCIEKNNVLPSHYIRWLLFPELIFPLNYNYNEIVNLTHKILNNKGFSLVPNVQNFDLNCVKRIYKINEQKSTINKIC